MSIKNTRYLWIAPLAGLLALPACTTTSERPTKTASAASAPADPAVGGTRA